MLAEFSVAPSDKSDSMSAYVAESLQIIMDSGIPYQINAMGTIVEGEPSEIFALIEKHLGRSVRKS